MIAFDVDLSTMIYTNHDNNDDVSTMMIVVDCFNAFSVRTRLKDDVFRHQIGRRSHSLGVARDHVTPSVLTVFTLVCTG